jgi:hypothetical protein
MHAIEQEEISPSARFVFHGGSSLAVCMSGERYGFKMLQGNSP